MLSSIELQQLFPSFELELIHEISNYALLKHFKEGDILMKTGQYFRSVLLIVNGYVKIFREDDEGNEYFIYYLQGGQACALSMICATRQQASELKAVASADTDVLLIPLEYMDRWMHTYKSWYYFVLENYRTRFQELLLTIDHIAFRHMDERLLHYLKRQQQAMHTDILTINHTEIAQELNSSREVISRLMKKLVESGMVEALKNQQIRILRLDTN